MKALCRWLGLAVLVMASAVGLLLLGARHNDGPVWIFAGGPFQSGDIAPLPADWSFVSDRNTVQFQTLNPVASRTIWFVVHDGRLFLTSGSMKSFFGARIKRWPYQIETDNRVVLRIDSKLYEQRLNRIRSGPDIMPVLDEFERKYGESMGIGTDEVTEAYTWMYEVVAR